MGVQVVKCLCVEYMRIDIQELVFQLRRALSVNTL